LTTRRTLQVALPEYTGSRGNWRRAVYNQIIETAAKQGVIYGEGESVDVRVELYVSPSRLPAHDANTRLKEILDALQGAVHGAAGKVRLPGVLKDEAQVRKATIEKMLAPKGARPGHGVGHLQVLPARFPRT
jgi:hypothetical protein